MTWKVLLSVVVLALSVLCASSMVRLRTARRELATLRAFAEKLLNIQEKERKRIAGELHSNVVQNLMIIKNCADLGLKPAADDGAAKQQLQEISKLCAQTIAESRQLAHNLGPRHLEQIGLTEAVDAMVDRVAASTGISFDRRLEPVDGVFEPDEATNVYRIAQEALNNLMKHARASWARVELLRDLRDVQLIVQDNGRGFDPSKLNGLCDGGFGLAEIAERTRILKGRLELASRPGAGTRVMVTIPIQNGK